MQPNFPKRKCPNLTIRNTIISLFNRGKQITFLFHTFLNRVENREVCSCFKYSIQKISIKKKRRKKERKKTERKKQARKAIKGSLIFHRSCGHSQPDYYLPCTHSFLSTSASHHQYSNLQASSCSHICSLVWGGWLYSIKCIKKALLQSKCLRVSKSFTPLKQARQEIDHDFAKQLTLKGIINPIYLKQALL